MDQLPPELLLETFSFLDLTSLCRAAQVSRRWKELAYDPSLYTVLDLRDCKFSRTAIYTLAKRCKRLRKLDVSNFGGDNLDLKEFMTATGSTLTHLSAGGNKITTLPDCSQLLELDMSMDSLCSQGDGGYGNLLACRHLQMIKLFFSEISMDIQTQMLKNNPGLRVLDIYYLKITFLDDFMKTLAEHNPNIVTLVLRSLWLLTRIGINHIAKLKNLRELTIGIPIRCFLNGSMKNIFTNCKKLTKLCISDLRDLSRDDVRCLVKHCTNLTHLDVSNNLIVNRDVCHKFLSNMPHLEKLFIFRCAVEAEEVSELKMLFPSCCLVNSDRSSGSRFRNLFPGGF